MKVSIVSTDNRYRLVNELLLKEGYDSCICTPDSLRCCDALILSVRNEFDEGRMKNLLNGIDKSTLILCGNNRVVFECFSGNVIDYSAEESFVQKNALLTAEGTISYLHTLTKESLNKKRIYVCGYGRIGRALCLLLKSFGADVYSYARRKEIVEEMGKDGIAFLPYENAEKCDIIINTVPQIIFTNSILKTIPHDRILIDLASIPYGFENMERVILASGIPGKILTKSGAQIIFETINSILSLYGKEQYK